MGKNRTSHYQLTRCGIQGAYEAEIDKDLFDIHSKRANAGDDSIAASEWITYGKPGPAA
jgi:hypothetical protein